MKFDEAKLLREVHNFPPGDILNNAAAVLVMGWTLGKGGEWFRESNIPTGYSLNTWQPSSDPLCALLVSVKAVSFYPYAGGWQVKIARSAELPLAVCRDVLAAALRSREVDARSLAGRLGLVAHG